MNTQQQQQQQQANCFYLFTMSIPVPSKTKTNFRSAIVSAIFLDRLEMDQEAFLKRMTLMKLNKFNFVFITSRATVSFNTETNSAYHSTLMIDIVNLDYFFSFEGFEEYFTIKKVENYEVVYCIEGCA